MRRIYVAGKYSDNNVIAMQGNMRRGIKLSLDVLRAGFAPFCPWIDFQFGLHEEITMERYLGYSMSFLEVWDAVLVVSQGYMESKGTLKEIDRAYELGIPVFYHLHDLIAWSKE